MAQEQTPRMTGWDDMLRMLMHKWTTDTRAQGYKTIFNLNSVEHKIYPADKYKNTNNFNNFPAEQSWEWNLSCY